MATREFDLQVEGLPAFIRSLRLSPLRVRTLERMFLAEAARTVQKWAQESARQQGGVAEKSADDIHVVGPGVVSYGGKPYNMGAEFGSYQYHQFERWRGKGDDAGYFLWPAIRKFRNTALAKLWLTDVTPALRDAFNDK